MGYILLEGGAEFGGQMEVPDRRALALAGGSGVRVSIIPAATQIYDLVHFSTLH